MEVESTGEARSWPRRKEGRFLGTTTLHFPPRRIGCPDRPSARHRRSWLRPGSPLVPNLPAVFVLLLPAFGRSKGFDIFFARAQEIQKINPFVPACLANTKESKVFGNGLGRRGPLK